MRGAVHLAATAVAALAAGCAATTVDVAFDDRHDFSRYRTWDWLPGARSVAAAPGEGRALEALTSRLVDRAFRGRGFLRRRDAPDLLVNYTLEVRRERVVSHETSAESFLSSHHASPSYVIQATTERIDIYDTGYLRIVVADRRGERVVWRGELRARRRGDFARHLSDAVSQLLGQLPTTTP